MMLIQLILQNINLMNQNIFFYLFIISGILFFTITLIIMKILKKKAIELKLIQQQHVAKVDIIRKEHSDTLEKIRVEMLKREEERSHQWMESEKETLHVLNGISSILDLTEKIDEVESHKILKKLDEIQLQVKKLAASE